MGHCQAGFPWALHFLPPIAFPILLSLLLPLALLAILLKNIIKLFKLGGNDDDEDEDDGNDEDDNEDDGNDDSRSRPASIVVHPAAGPEVRLPLPGFCN